MARARSRKAAGSERPPRWSDSVAAEALRAMPEAVVVCDREGRIVAANEAVHELLGYPDGKLVGRRLEKLVPEDLRDLHRTHREAFVEQQGPGAHRAGRLFKARHRDGHLVPVDVAIANLRAEDGPLSLALIRGLDDPSTAGKQITQLADLYAVMARALAAVLHADSEADLFASVCDVAIDHGGVTLAWVGEVDDGAVWPVAVSGPLAEAVDDLAANLGADEPVAMAVTMGSSVVVPDLTLEPAFRIAPFAAPDQAGSLCALPLRRGGTTIGVLALVSPEISGFTDEAVTVLEWLAAEMSFALDELDRPEPEPEPEPEPAVAPLDDEDAVPSDEVAEVAEAGHRRRRC